MFTYTIRYWSSSLPIAFLVAVRAPQLKKQQQRQRQRRRLPSFASVTPPSSMGTRVYVGGLPRDATTREIQDQFSRYGHVSNIWIARNPPGFAFVVS